MDYVYIVYEEIEEWEDSQNLTMSNISKKNAKVKVKGKGKASCIDCGNEWTSRHTRVSFNFRAETDDKVYKIGSQGCKFCELFYVMSMTEKEFRRITIEALERMEERHYGQGGGNSVGNRVRRGPPHLCYLCEDCLNGSCCISGNACNT
ncbi:uncharacterized protein [Diadema antillarum]|uniref:uncharacterized protein n=1 Tax=Diadema antillarum TaxID=105358 RepID=UPI003A8B9549